MALVKTDDDQDDNDDEVAAGILKPFFRPSRSYPEKLLSFICGSKSDYVLINLMFI